MSDLRSSRTLHVQQRQAASRDGGRSVQRCRARGLLAGGLSALRFSTGPATAGGAAATARTAMQLFADHCFSPFMTAQKAGRAFALSGAAYDFYDLDPYSSAAPSPAAGRAVTPGTDRRCEISFAGDPALSAVEVTLGALDSEGITTLAALPTPYAETEGTVLLAARQLNPRRVAVVEVGTRSGATGIETFMRVERLEPSQGTSG